MKRRADSLSTATINDRRVVTVTGRVVGSIPCGDRVQLVLDMAADAEVEVGT